MAKNADLTLAKKRKKDEFYTQLTDIEKEMCHYWAHFAGKTVLCNCDDPRSSNFFKYFSENFEALKLKKLIATCFKSQDLFDFSQGKNEHGVCQIYEGDKNGNLVVDDDEVGVRELEGDGSFDSPECITLLKEADIVVTNPPFSLFREYLQILIKHEKKFIIIGNVNAITYKECFQLIKDGKMWLGASIHSGDREFGVPKDYPLEATGCRIDERGRKYIRVKGVRWFTNLDYKSRHEDLPLYKKYTEEEFPKYDNYDAIEVSATSDIPMDYEGIMGVPITFMDKFCPEQFEIVWQASGNTRASAPKEVLSKLKYKINSEDRGGCSLINGVRTYGRILIRHRKERKNEN